MSAKVGVEMEGQIPQLIQLNQGEPLAAIIKELCKRWNASNPELYALQWQDKSKPYYVTERNRVDIMDGNVLKLTFTPSKIAEDLVKRLSSGTMEEMVQALRTLSTESVYVAFAQEFIAKRGLKLLMSMIEGGTLVGDSLGFALKAFVELMDHQIESWTILEPKFIKQVASAVNVTRNTVPDATTLQLALEILESIVLHSTGRYSVVEQEVTSVTLIEHLQRTKNAETQKRVITLINALFLKADHSKQKKIAEKLQSKSIRNVILNNVIQGTSLVGAQEAGRQEREPSISKDREMAHQLYVLQTLLFNLLEEHKMTPVDPGEQSSLKDINELRKVAFEAETESGPASGRKQMHTKEYKKLGFKNHVNPVEDFRQVPPGCLGLQCMVYFARAHVEEYTKVVLENCSRADDHDLPFAQASIDLIKVLCDILKVGELPNDDGVLYYQMFFTHEKPFEEFFCICIQLLNKTWKEMRATSADFPKVMEVAQEQITRTLKKPVYTQQLGIFKERLHQLSYSEITKIWTKERKNKEEWKSQATPIVELREMIRPEIMELIKQQRLMYIVEGTNFHSKIKNRDRFCFCRLSPNHKMLHYGDCEEGAKPPIEKLLHKLCVVDIKSLITGKHCPHVKERRKVNSSNLAFTIMTENEMVEPINFIAADSTTFSMWTDAINALLGNPMVSELTEQDLEMLLSMEVRLRLLDTEGITIPETPPPIPDEPPNYDFAYNV